MLALAEASELVELVTIGEKDLDRVPASLELVVPGEMLDKLRETALEQK